MDDDWSSLAKEAEEMEQQYLAVLSSLTREQRKAVSLDVLGPVNDAVYHAASMAQRELFNRRATDAEAVPPFSVDEWEPITEPGDTTELVDMSERIALDAVFALALRLKKDIDGGAVFRDCYVALRRVFRDEPEVLPFMRQGKSLAEARAICGKVFGGT